MIFARLEPSVWPAPPLALLDPPGAKIVAPVPPQGDSSAAVPGIVPEVGMLLITSAGAPVVMSTSWKPVSDDPPPTLLFRNTGMVAAWVGRVTPGPSSRPIAMTT